MSRHQSGAVKRHNARILRGLLLRSHDILELEGNRDHRFFGEEVELRHGTQGRIGEKRKAAKHVGFEDAKTCEGGFDPAAARIEEFGDVEGDLLVRVADGRRRVTKRDKGAKKSLTSSRGTLPYKKETAHGVPKPGLQSKIWANLTCSFTAIPLSRMKPRSASL